MKKIIYTSVFITISVLLQAQDSYKEFEDEWRNNPLRFLVAETHQTTVWIDIGDGNPKRSVKPLVEGRVLIGVDTWGDISIVSEDNTIFHTHKVKDSPNDIFKNEILTGVDDELGEYVEFDFNCDMYFSDLNRNEEYSGPCKITYRLYTTLIFMVFEHSEEKLGSNIRIIIQVCYLGKYVLEQVESIMKIA